MAHLCCGHCKAKLIDSKLLARDVFMDGVCLTWASEAAGKEIFPKFVKVPASGEKKWQIWKLHCRECNFDIGSIAHDEKKGLQFPLFPAKDTFFVCDDETTIKLNSWKQLSTPAIASTPSLAHLASSISSSPAREAIKPRRFDELRPHVDIGSRTRLPNPEPPAISEPERPRPDQTRQERRAVIDRFPWRYAGEPRPRPERTGFKVEHDAGPRFASSIAREYDKAEGSVRATSIRRAVVDRNSGERRDPIDRKSDNEEGPRPRRAAPPADGHQRREGPDRPSSRQHDHQTSWRGDVRDRTPEEKRQMEATSNFRMYLRDARIPFRTQHQMRAFVLGAASIPDVPTLLQDLGSPNGITRIREICSGKISISAGTTPSQVSFQRVILPLLRLVTHHPVANSTLTSQVNEILACMHSSGNFTRDLGACLKRTKMFGLEDITYSDQDRQQDSLRMEVWEPKSWVDVVEAVAEYAYLILAKFNAIHEESVQALITELQQSFERFVSLRTAQPTDKCEERNVGDRVKLVVRIWDAEKRRQQREKDRKDRQALFPPIAAASADEVPIDGPGTLSLNGARHNNDCDDITNIRVSPTSDEILCRRPPYLPRNVANAAHHLSDNPILRHLDTHFRLLRHDFVAPLCESLRLFIDSGGARSGQITKSGRFKPKNAGGQDGGGDNVDMFVFRNIAVKGIRVKSPHGVVFMVECDQPLHLQSRTRKDRKDFWKNSSSLSPGSLVCLYDPENMIFGEVNFRDLDLLAGPKQEFDEKNSPITRLQVGVSVRGRNERETLLRMIIRPVATEQVLVQSNISYFAYEPVLTALQNLARGKNLPFAKYLCPSEDERKQEAQVVDVPAYLRASHTMDFSCILRDDVSIPEDKRKILEAVPIHTPEHFPSELLAQFSTLDATQIEALKAGLTQEVALLQGPPGTGKTYVGILLVLLFLKNSIKRAATEGGRYRAIERPEAQTKPCIGPILCVCYTNHAIDQLLCGLLDKGIKNIVRIGGRCTNERLEEFNLRNLSSRHEYGRMKFEAHQRLDKTTRLVEEAQAATGHFLEKVLSWNTVESMLEFKHPEIHQDFLAIDEEGFEGVGRDWQSWLGATQHQPQQKQQPQSMVGTNRYEHLTNPPTATVHLPRKEQRQRAARSLDDLLSGKIRAWDMSHQERMMLHDHWRNELLDAKFIELQEAIEQCELAQKELENVHQEANRSVISKVDVIGMTTSGVAKHQNLITGLGPRIVLVEEAAEVLEAHILVCLSSLTQHLILIGDHLQLRPKIECYQLTAEFSRTQGYNLDISLFERLVCTGNRLPIHTLSTQRRMRPEISSLIRTSVYPGLLDHESVKTYPDVLGMSKNLYFLDHNKPEDAQNADGQKSKRNRFEVAMVQQLAAYLLRQGYQPGDITILTPYVGQLLLLRNELSKLMMVFVDEKDEEQLAAIADEEVDEKEPHAPEKRKKGAPKQASNKRRESKQSDEEEAGEGKEQKEEDGVVLTKDSIRNRVRMATIDNFQGEESKVIIISLVRNNSKGSIGFLKTMNRTNVLLSRAMHGMYILGNSRTLRIKKSHAMWANVLDQLEAQKLLGESLSLRCQNHPQTVSEVRAPEDFKIKAGDGGCSLQCEFRLPKCGHSCPRRCHPDDPRHATTSCPKPCMRIRQPEICPEGHTCPRPCGEECGPCEVQVKNVPLPCGHVKPQIECYKVLDPSTIYCSVPCEVEMATCGHKLQVPCSRVSHFLGSPESCTARCGKALSCSHECKHRCGDCFEAENPHSCMELCGRGLTCGHACKQQCHGTSDCLVCAQPCLQQCVHSACSLRCNESCNLCTEPCTWFCKHQGQCPVPCGTPCSRLPCDQRCERLLDCKHRCPGLCGEICPSSKYCIEGCKVSDEVKAMQVDVLTLGSFQDYIEEQHEKDAQADPLIFLPCDHILTVSSLDGHFDLTKYYQRQGTEWKEPLPFEKQLTTIVKKCPWCQTPIVNGFPRKSKTSLNRYGRVLNTIHVDSLQRKFMQHCQTKTQEFVDAFRDISSKFRDLSPKSLTVALLLQCKELHRREVAAEGIMENAPTRRAFTAAQAALQRIKSPIPIQTLVVPEGDQLSLCRLRIQMADTSSMLMTLLSSTLLDRVPGKIQPPDWRKAESEFQAATKRLEQARDTAASCNAKKTAALAMHRHARLLIERARSLHRALHIIQRKESQLALVEGARMICNALLTEPSVATEAQQTLETLPALITSIKNEKFYQPVTEEETKSVMDALGLRGTGWGQGHWYRCKNGHLYAIGECGGAMQESKCNECGETIGGSSHRLRSDNTSVMEEKK